MVQTPPPAVGNHLVHAALKKRLPMVAAAAAATAGSCCGKQLGITSELPSAEHFNTRYSRHNEDKEALQVLLPDEGRCGWCSCFLGF